MGSMGIKILPAAHMRLETSRNLLSVKQDAAQTAARRGVVGDVRGAGTKQRGLRD